MRRVPGASSVSLHMHAEVCVGLHVGAQEVGGSPPRRWDSTHTGGVEGFHAPVLPTFHRLPLRRAGTGDTSWLRVRLVLTASPAWSL